MSHVLDRPAWNALTTRHSALSEGGALAKRYDPSIIPFAAARDDSDEALQALATLPAPGEGLLLAEPRASFCRPDSSRSIPRASCR